MFLCIDWDRLRWSAESLEASLMPAWPQLASLDLQKLSRRRWQRSPTSTRSSTRKEPTSSGWKVVPIHAENIKSTSSPAVKPKISKGTGRRKGRVSCHKDIQDLQMLIGRKRKWPKHSMGQVYPSDPRVQILFKIKTALITIYRGPP